jgi:hypothetical protein
MGWLATQYKQVRKEPRHARVRLDVIVCADCRRPLPQTHQIAQFGERCRQCWKSLVVLVPGGSIVLDQYSEG